MIVLAFIGVFVAGGVIGYFVSDTVHVRRLRASMVMARAQAQAESQGRIQGYNEAKSELLPPR